MSKTRSKASSDANPPCPFGQCSFIKGICTNCGAKQKRATRIRGSKRHRSKVRDTVNRFAKALRSNWQ